MVPEEKLEVQELLKRHPAEVAEVLAALREEEALELLRRLYLRRAAAAPLGEMDPEEAARLLAELNRDEAVQILQRMDPDDAVDLLAELPKETVQDILRRLEEREAKTLSELLSYPPDTAGGLMSPEVVALPKDMTCQDAIEALRRVAEEMETVYYAYVVDEQRRLIGVLSLRDLVFARPEAPIRQVMRTDIVALPEDMDVEEVARTFDKYNFLALPVIDKEGKLLGIVTVDDVIDVIREEDTEDIYRLAGAPLEERVDTPWWRSLRLRLPWLYFNLLTAFLAASVVGAFESVIAKVAALAIFMPVIAGQGGNAGMQTVTIVTRGIALGEVPKGKGWRLLGKELLLGFLHGLLVGATVGAIAYVWKGSFYLGLVAFLAMLFNLVAAGVSGAVIPLTLRALRLDPALASSIFLTTVTDTLGFFFLLGLGMLFLDRL
ncbi:MAG: Magnesium transporter [Acetothermia bacterium 64_32]|nr:MAG: Magnesium transporter [Acetothermia bacterium 64_32]HAF69933.1 magnesium transporter [Candidatus Acetothermia bacterium]